MPALTIRIIRDALLLFGTWLLLQASHHEQTASWMLKFPLALAAGGMIAFAAFVVHEWGHLIGAWASGSRVEVARSPLSMLLFNFEDSRNSRKQFLAMTSGGFLASALTVAFLFATLSFHQLADAIALALTAAGVVATFVIEVPPAWRVLRSALEGRAYVPGGGGTG